jgi:hypothetical protein
MGILARVVEPEVDWLSLFSFWIFNTRMIIPLVAVKLTNPLGVYGEAYDPADTPKIVPLVVNAPITTPPDLVIVILFVVLLNVNANPAPPVSVFSADMRLVAV